MKQFFIIIVLAGLFSFCACSPNIVEPEKRLDISGYYQSSDNTMVLSIIQETDDRKYSGTLQWNATIIEVKGIFDRDMKQILLSGNFQGIQNISFSLCYSTPGGNISGGFNYNLQGTRAISFTFRYRLYKHDQGAVYTN